MLELNFNNLELLLQKSEEVTKLERMQNENKMKYTEAFEQLLMHPGVSAVVTLCGDEFYFRNEFTDPNIKLKRKYGIRNQNLVLIMTPDTTIEKTDTVDEEITEASTDNLNDGNFNGFRTKKLKPSYFVSDIMKDSLNISEIYDAWVSQIVDKGNELAKA